MRSSAPETTADRRFTQYRNGIGKPKDSLLGRHSTTVDLGRAASWSAFRELRVHYLRTDFDFGDAASGSLGPDPGTPYDPADDCGTCESQFGHTYREPGPVTITAHTYWQGHVALAVAVLAFALAVFAIVQARARRRDPTDEALAELQALVAEETASAADELKSRLARMRADALSSLVEEERKIADERRREFAERERAAGVELAEALTVAARRVDERLRTWGDELDRAHRASRRTCGGSSSARSS